MWRLRHGFPIAFLVEKLASFCPVCHLCDASTLQSPVGSWNALGKRCCLGMLVGVCFMLGVQGPVQGLAEAGACEPAAFLSGGKEGGKKRPY